MHSLNITSCIKLSYRPNGINGLHFILTSMISCAMSVSKPNVTHLHRITDIPVAILHSIFARLHLLSLLTLSIQLILSILLHISKASNLRLVSARPCPCCHTFLFFSSRFSFSVALSRVYTRTHVARYKLYPLVSTCRRQHVSTTKLSPVCRLSVAGYKGIQVDRDINE